MCNYQSNMSFSCSIRSRSLCQPLSASACLSFCLCVFGLSLSLKIACLLMCVCVCACVHACMRVCMCAYVCACVVYSPKVSDSGQILLHFKVLAVNSIKK